MTSKGSKIPPVRPKTQRVAEENAGPRGRKDPGTGGNGTDQG